MKHGLYVASRASLPARGEMWRRFRSEGVPIVSTWIDEDGPDETADFGDLWERIAAEISGSQALVLYVEEGDFPLKGALIEVGMALAQGIPVHVAAPGVILDERSMRPLGSWAAHPRVTIHQKVETAIMAALISVPGLAGARIDRKICAGPGV